MELRLLQESRKMFRLTAILLTFLTTLLFGCSVEKKTMQSTLEREAELQSRRLSELTIAVSSVSSRILALESKIERQDSTITTIRIESVTEVYDTTKAAAEQAAAPLLSKRVEKKSIVQQKMAKESAESRAKAFSVRDDSTAAKERTYVAESLSEKELAKSSSITRLKPWYKRWWAYLGALVIFLGAINFFWPKNSIKTLLKN